MSEAPFFWTTAFVLECAGTGSLGSEDKNSDGKILWETVLDITFFSSLQLCGPGGPRRAEQMSVTSEAGDGHQME